MITVPIQPKHTARKRILREHQVVITRDHLVSYLKGLGYDVPANPKMRLCDIDHVDDDLDSGYISVEWEDHEYIEVEP